MSHSGSPAEAAQDGQTMRRRLMVFPLDALFDVLKADDTLVSVLGHPLPTDTRIVGGSFNSLNGQLTLALESETFEPVPVVYGAMLPRMHPPALLVGIVDGSEDDEDTESAEQDDANA